jgi:uncharacterized protein
MPGPSTIFVLQKFIDAIIFCMYEKAMAITFDPNKREATLTNRGLDFLDAAKVFAGDRATWPDDRDYNGEQRFITAGRLNGRMVVIAWTPRGADKRVISMRYCHAKEIRKIEARYGI